MNIKSTPILIFLLWNTMNLCAADHAVDAAHDIARRLIEQATKTIEEEAAKMEQAWKDEEVEIVSVGKLMASCDKILRDSFRVISASFFHYTAQEAERFASLRDGYVVALDTPHPTVASITCKDPQEVSSEDELKKLPEVERKKQVMRIALRAPRIRNDYTCLFPIEPRLMLGRLLFMGGHEFGHILNEYNKKRESLLAVKRSWNKILLLTAEVGLAYYTQYQAACMLVNERPWSFVGWQAATLGAAYLAATSLLRDQPTNEEHAADATALMLMPKSMRHGAVVDITEMLCFSNYFYMQRSWIGRLTTTLLDTCKCLVSSQHHIHPPTRDRLLNVTTILVEETPAEKREQYVARLEQTAAATLANFNVQIRNPIAKKASEKAQADIRSVFSHVRARYELSTN
jgi:hypothetical protein